MKNIKKSRRQAALREINLVLDEEFEFDYHFYCLCFEDGYDDYYYDDEREELYLDNLAYDGNLLNNLERFGLFTPAAIEKFRKNPSSYKLVSFYNCYIEVSLDDFRTDKSHLLADFLPSVFEESNKYGLSLILKLSLDCMLSRIKRIDLYAYIEEKKVTDFGSDFSFGISVQDVLNRINKGDYWFKDSFLNSKVFNSNEECLLAFLLDRNSCYNQGIFDTQGLFDNLLYYSFFKAYIL